MCIQRCVCEDERNEPALGVLHFQLLMHRDRLKL